MRSHHTERHRTHRIGWLRATVLGANDGIVSTASLLLGVVAAQGEGSSFWVAGVAALVAGAMSMAAGEYVSVYSQADTERADIERERAELHHDAAAEHRELAAIYVGRGLTPALARDVATQLMAHDALAAHSEIELGIEPGHYTNPWSAAIASALSFSVGALVPLLALVLSPKAAIVPVTVVAVIVALIVTGVSSARLGGAPVGRAALRNAAGGLLAMAVTYGIGKLVGTQL